MKELERLVMKRYTQYRKIDKIEDKELCRKQALDGVSEDLIDISVFDKLDKIIDGECDCQSINDEACVELIEDKFDKQDAEKVAEKFSLEFPLDDILEGLNVELEHKNITGGDLEETAKIVIAHLKERGDYYKRLKKYVETKDSHIIYDTVSIHNKKATIMRDGYYKYLAGEVDRNANYPRDIVTVYRPPEEVKKAYDRFMELRRLPAIANHPESDLDLKDENSFRDGECINPKLKIINGTTVIDCDLSNLKGKVKEFYDKGIKEISCGWHGEYEKVDCKDYQYIQRFKDFNHVAILERGRCGDICSIKDTQNTKDEVLDMTKEELEKMVNDKIAEKIEEIKKVDDAKAFEGKETPAEEKKEEEEAKKEDKKEEKNEEEIEDAYLSGDEDEDELEKAKGKLKKFKDCFAKMKAKKVEVKDLDSLIIDGKPAITGETREWNGIKYKKIAEGRWEKIKEDKNKKEEIKQKSLKEHPQWNENDYLYLIEKGWTNKEIRERWDEEHKQGKSPVKWDTKEAKAKFKATVKDEETIIIYDKNIEDAKITIKDEFIAEVKGIYDSIEMGILTAKEVTDKLPNEIKAMAIKKVLNKDIDINDKAMVDTLFDLALKNYENPVWSKKVNDSGLVGMEALRAKSKQEFEKVAKGEKLGGN